MQQPVEPPDPRWPWWPFELGSLTDLTGIVLSLVGLIVAWRVYLFTRTIGLRQLEIMDGQTAMMRRQDDSNERMEKLTIEQGALAKRQTELAEAQNDIIQSQLQKRTDLRLRTPSSRRSSDDVLTCRLVVMNGGNLTAVGCHWEVFMKRGETHYFEFMSPDFIRFTPQFSAFSESEQYEKVEGFVEERIYPGTSIDIATITIRGTAPEEFSLYWRIKCDEGLVPPEGLAQIDFRRESAGLVENRYPDHWADKRAPVDNSRSTS